MLWAACTTAFGFFRLGEITAPSAALFDHHPPDIAIDCRETPSLVQIHLRISKTDQERKGISVFIGSTSDDLCPVAAITAYMALRGDSQGPFFRFSNTRPLTKDQFTKHVREALTYIGYNPEAYASHSFRGGAATTAAERGIEDSVIKALGRWKSDLYQNRTERVGPGLG
jgi:hypothetical protein